MFDHHVCNRYKGPRCLLAVGMNCHRESGTRSK